MNRKKSPNEIRQAGMAALTQTLGPVDALRFLLQFEMGKGDYTLERSRILGNPTVKELLRELKIKKQMKK